MKIQIKPKPPEQEESKLLDYFLPLIAMGIIYVACYVGGKIMLIWIHH